jgi:HD-GYP domain-containing protein (c-di-GMP phosphodiesterase class II)
MSTSRPLSLHYFVYRVLTVRLLLMAIGICLITGITVYFTEQQNLSAMVAEETRIEVQRLVNRAAAMIKESGVEDRTAFRQALDERTVAPMARETGSYVYVCFYRPDDPVAEERRDSGYEHAREVSGFIRMHPRPIPEKNGLAEVITLGGRMHVYAVLPMFDLKQERIAFVQAVFAPSETTLQTIAQKLRRTVILTMLIVLATSGLLYPVILHLVNRLTLFSRNLLEANLDTLTLLASAIAKRDSDTDAHNFRVTLYAVRLAESLRLNTSELQALIKGAFLHDVGKIGVRDKILLKAGRLDAEEFSLMQEHVRHGMEIISGSEWLRDAAQVVESHHEKYDGSGYPQGKTGEAIPLLARIFAVADVFDALTSRRPYKEPFSCEAAFAILEQGRGTHFDPRVLDAFQLLAPQLYRSCVDSDAQQLRNDLRTVITRYFSEGLIVSY